MRQEPNQLGQVQRQVTARPTQSIQAPQVRGDVHPAAGQLSQGIMSFLNTAQGVVQQSRAEYLDAQAASADIGMDGYMKAMQGALKTRPDLHDKPDELAELDSEMRERYFADVQDERVRGRVTQRLNGWLQAEGHTYQLQKAEKQRFDLGFKTLQLSAEKLEAQLNAGADPAQVKDAFRSVVNHLKTSPSFSFSQETVEHSLRTLMEGMNGDGTRSLLVAEAYKDDPELSAETQMWMQAAHAKASALTAAEKETLKIGVYQEWTELAKKGRMTWAKGQEAVEAGLMTASSLKSMMKYQDTEQRRLIKEAQDKVSFFGLNPLNVSYVKPADLKSALTNTRLAAETGQLPGGLNVYYEKLRQLSMADPIAEERISRGFNALTAPVVEGEELPEVFKAIANSELPMLYGRGELGRHLPPELAEKATLYMVLTQDMGKDPVDAANLFVKGAFEKYLDISRLDQKGIRSAVQAELNRFGHDDPVANASLIGSTTSLALRLTKAANLEPKDAITKAVEVMAGGHFPTKYGAFPIARTGAYPTSEAVEKRVAFAAQETLKAYPEFDDSDIQAQMLPDGRFYFTNKGGDIRLGAVHAPLMLSNETHTPDGQLTVEGARQESLIDEQLKPRRAKRGQGSQ